MFCRRPNEPLLRNHQLQREWSGFWSININGDIRAIYTEKVEEGTKIAYFITIGTHKELYRS